MCLPYVGLVTSRAEPSFEHFELGLLIYEWARARAELLNELKIRLKLGLIFLKKAWLELIRLVFHMNELELNLEPIQVCIVINHQAQSIYFLTFCNQSDNKYIN